MTFDSKEISNIGVKIFTKEPVFVLTNDNISNLNFSTLQKELRNVDWDFEYSSTEIETILQDGIDNKSLSLDYLSAITDLKKKTERTYHAPQLDLYLQFEGEYLTSYNSTDGLSGDSKWLKEINPELFNSMMNEAREFHQSEMDAKVEVNNQCRALRSIPDATNNDYLEDHSNSSGNYNFYNLQAAHYLPEFTKDEFIHVNKGRFIQLTNSQIKVDNFVYEFDENEILSKSWKE